MDLVDRRTDPQVSPERAHLVGLLRHWASRMGDEPWTGVPPTHKALLEHLASVLDPREP